MSTKNWPHFTLKAGDLANWLEAQGSECWWTVDGDPVLTQRVSFPCPGEDLASQIRAVGKDLLLYDYKDQPESRGQSVGLEQLDSLAFRDVDHEDRVFQFRWKDDSSCNDWILFEDKEAAIQARFATIGG